MGASMSSLSGEQFGRYELVSQLGRGGMAETYRARLLGEAGVTKPVLIKKVLPEFATDQAFIDMFISEARISATLSHGNIAQVYDFGRVDGEYFLAMEYVDGQPLHRLMKRAVRSGLSALPVPLATFIALELCRGLHYAHTRTDSSGRLLGIVHRDISPDNVLVSYEGQVKIVDFGIAKARELRGFNTEPGVVKGKYLFFSPEQARGEEVDALTDVWATGIVLYEMLCSRMPVDDLPHVAVPKLVRGEFPRPAVLRPDLPPELDAIVMRALAVNRQERFESSHAFGEALTEFLYSTTPRFSALSLSHFVQELFREDLATVGHQVQVPGSFKEQMAQWRSQLPTAVKPSQLPTAVGPTAVPRTPSPLPSSIPTEAHPPPRSLKPLFLGVGAAAAILGAGLTAFLLVKAPASPAAAEASRPLSPEPPSTPAPTPAVASTETAAASEDSTPPDEPPPPQEPETAVTRASASYPVEAIRLDSRHDLIDLRSITEVLALEPGTTYRVSEPEPPKDSPPLFFWLAGPQVRAKDGVGVLSQRPVQVKGASALKLFALQPVPPGTPARQVLVENVQAKAREKVAVAPTTVASMERAFELKNLDTGSTYRLLLMPLEGGAYTRGPDAGAVESLACARLPAEPPATGAAAPGSNREQQFLLREGATLNLSGATHLLCGFIDDDPADNRGELQLRITRTSGGPAWPGPSPYSLVVPNKTGELQQTFEQAMRLFSERKYDTAAIFAERCISLAPRDADCQLLAGATYAAIPGRVDRAAKHYRTFLELAPGHSLAPQVVQSLKEHDAGPGDQVLK
jgi:serine/threonine-protein kinase